MIKGQTLKNSEGIEVVLFPMEYCRITQSIDGGTSHKGVNSLDNGGKPGGNQLDEVYAPFTMKLVKIMTTWKENPLIFQSVDKVQFADGTVDYATFRTMHEDNISRFKVGQVFKQGEFVTREGNAGYSTGNHVHMEIAKGHLNDVKLGDGNKYSLSLYPKDTRPDLMYYINDTTVDDSSYPKNAIKMNWKKYVPNELTKVNGVLTVTTENGLKERSKPSIEGSHVRVNKKGTKLRYVGWLSDAKYYWYKLENGNYTAYREIGGTKFAEYKDDVVDKPKYRALGSTVIVNGNLFGNSAGTSTGKVKHSNKKATISKILEGAIAPYHVTGSGISGWGNEALFGGAVAEPPKIKSYTRKLPVGTVLLKDDLMSAFALPIRTARTVTVVEEKNGFGKFEGGLIGVSHAWFKL